MNLGDLEDTSKSRSNLYIGPFETTYSNNVDIYGGDIRVDHLKLDSGNINDFLLYNKENKLEWSKNNDFDGWAFAQDIIISSFSNTNYYTKSTDLSDVSFNGSFKSLINLPTIDDIIPDNYDTESNLYSCKSNLSEVAESLELHLLTRAKRFERVNHLFDNTLGNLSYEPEILPQLQYINFTNFNMLSDDMPIDSYLYSSHTLIDDLTVRNKIIWNHPFLEMDGSLKSEHFLVDDFLQNPIPNSSVKIKNLGVFYKTIKDKIETLQKNINVDRVKKIITNNVETGVYLIASNLLNDIGDKTTVYTNLNLGSISTQDSQDVVINNLNVTKTLTFGFSEYDISKQYLTVDETGIILSNLPFSSDTNTGFVKLKHLYDNNLYTPEHIVPSVNFIKDMSSNIRADLTTIESTLRYFFDELDDPPDGILDSNLSGYSTYNNYQLDKLGVYSNLEIPKVCFTNNYSDLLHKPNNITYFENNIRALSKYNLFSGNESLDIDHVMINLSLSNMIFQSTSSVNILDGDSVFSTVNTKELYIQPPPYTNILDKVLLHTDNNKAIWHDLQIANETMYGVVKKINDYRVDSRDSVVLGQNIKDMKGHLDTLLDAIENKIDSIEDKVFV
jgi:hypothetical protein